MRKISILMGRIVCLLLVLCLAGCGGGNADLVEAANERAASAADTAEETQAPEESEEPDVQEEAPEPELEDSAEVETVEELLGTTQDGVYTNEFLGIGCQIPEDWTYYTEEEIAEQNRSVLEALSDLEMEGVDLEALEGRELMDMFALDAIGNNVSVSISKMSVFEALALTAEDLVEAAEEGVLALYQGMELTDTTTAIETYNAFGEDRPVLRITVPMEEGLNMYQTILIIKEGLYYGTINVTSPGEDITDEVMSWFYGLD